MHDTTQSSTRGSGRKGQAAVEYFILAMAVLAATIFLWSNSDQLQGFWDDQFTNFVNTVNVNP